MKKLVFLMTAAVALAACSNDDELLDNNVVNNSPAKGEKVTVIATLPSDGSRLALEEENNIIKVDWKESGESFTVMNTEDVMNEENETAYVFTQTEGDAFTGTLPTAVEDKPYYAFYPAIDLSDETETFSPDHVPYSFLMQDGTLNEANTLMYATSEDGEQFDFHHLTAIVKFTLTGLPAGAEFIDAIYLLMDGKVRPSYGCLDLTKETVKEMYSSSEESVIVIDAEGDAVGDDGTYSFYAYLPPMDQGQLMSIYFFAQDDVNQYYGEASVELDEKPIEAGKFYRATRAVDVIAVPNDYKMEAGSVEELQAWMKATEVFGGRISLTLTADIDLTNADLDGDPDNGSNWIPFVLYSGTTIDGAGHTITGMKVHTEANQGRASMFDNIRSDAVVKNLHLRDVDFYTKNLYVGGIATNNHGSIIGCSVTGNIKSDATGYWVAGIAGSNSGSIIACWSTATLTSGLKTYGITENNTGTVTACYYSGEVDDAGGGTEVNGTTVTWESAASAMNEALPEDFGWRYGVNTDVTIPLKMVMDFIPV